MAGMQPTGAVQAVLGGIPINPLTLLWGDAMVGVRLHRIQGDLRSR